MWRCAVMRPFDVSDAKGVDVMGKDIGRRTFSFVGKQEHLFGVSSLRTSVVEPVVTSFPLGFRHVAIRYSDV